MYVVVHFRLRVQAHQTGIIIAPSFRFWRVQKIIFSQQAPVAVAVVAAKDIRCLKTLLGDTHLCFCVIRRTILHRLQLFLQNNYLLHYLLFTSFTIA